jgi:glycosyltransferase involved in cell wall biosynthesis
VTDPPVRVAVDASMLAWQTGGIGRYAGEILRRLVSDRRLDLTLLFNAHEPPFVFEQARTYSRRMKGAVTWRHGVVLPYLWRARPDLYWSPWVAAPVTVPVPMVLTVHDLAPVMFRIKPPAETLAYRTLGRRSARRAAHCFVDTPGGGRDLERIWGIPPSRISVVPVGVDTDQFTPGDRRVAKDLIRRRYGLAAPFALAVGTVEDRKGYDLLAELLEQGRLPCDVVIAGRFVRSARNVVARLQATGRVTLLEFVPDEDLVELYRAAEVLLCPSVYEGFGLSPVEAMACGTPAIIATGAGALSEVSGPAAVSVPRDTESWDRGVRDVLADRSKWAERGRELALAYSWKRSAELAATALLRVAGRRPRSAA